GRLLTAFLDRGRQLKVFGPEVGSANGDLRDSPVLAEADRLLAAACVLWEHLRMDHLAHQMGGRRVQFAAARRASAKDVLTLQPYAEALAPAVAGPGRTALLACLAMAEGMRASRDLLEGHLSTALDLCLGGDFGTGLKDLVALAATRSFRGPSFRL